MRVIIGNTLAQTFETGMNRVAVLLFKYDAHGGLAYAVGRWKVRLAQSQIDAARTRTVEDLPYHALLDSAKSLGRKKIAQRKTSSNCTERSVFSSRYFTITGV